MLLSEQLPAGNEAVIWTPRAGHTAAPDIWFSAILDAKVSRVGVAVTTVADPSAKRYTFEPMRMAPPAPRGVSEVATQRMAEAPKVAGWDRVTMGVGVMGSRYAAPLPVSGVAEPLVSANLPEVRPVTVLLMLTWTFTGLVGVSDAGPVKVTSGLVSSTGKR